MSEIYEKTVKRIEANVMPTYAPKQLFVRGEGCRPPPIRSSCSMR